MKTLLLRIASSFKNKKAITIDSPQFQQIHRGLDDRWGLIRHLLPSNKCWILDVGSNLGDTVRRLALAGHVVVGIESEPRLIESAFSDLVPYGAFMLGKADENFFSSMPDFHTILFLSVLHRMWATNGQAFPERCLHACLKSGPYQVIVEGAIRHERYTDQGYPAPAFESNDIDSGVPWHLEWLGAISNPLGYKVEHIGNVTCSDLEPVRPLFLLKKS